VTCTVRASPGGVEDERGGRGDGGEDGGGWIGGGGIGGGGSGERGVRLVIHVERGLARLLLRVNPFKFVSYEA
jgi:hypothetical protein